MFVVKSHINFAVDFHLSVSTNLKEIGKSFEWQKQINDLLDRRMGRCNLFWEILSIFKACIFDDFKA